MAMTDYELDPLTGDPIAKSGVSKHQRPDDNRITEAEMASIEQMDAMALRKLIQRVSGAMWGIGLKTREDIAEAFKLKLAIGGMTERDMFKALPIMREWFDRELGKTTQYIHQVNENISKTAAYELTNAQLVNELRKLQAADKLPEGVLLLEDGTITLENDMK